MRTRSSGPSGIYAPSVVDEILRLECPVRSSRQDHGISRARIALALVQSLRDRRGGSEQQPKLLMHWVPALNGLCEGDSANIPAKCHCGRCLPHGRKQSMLSVHSRPDFRAFSCILSLCSRCNCSIGIQNDGPGTEHKLRLWVGVSGRNGLECAATRRRPPPPRPRTRS